MNTELREIQDASVTGMMSAEEPTLSEATVRRLQEWGVSRRRFLTYCAGMASVMALPQALVPKLAAAATGTLEGAAVMAGKPSVVYMSFQECTGCLESMVNSFAFGGGEQIENLILKWISLDYQETLMAAAGKQAEDHLLAMTDAARAGYVLVVDGSIPRLQEQDKDGKPGYGYFVSGGRSGVARFLSAAENAGLIIAVGTCASFGGLPHAFPNPTDAMSIDDVMREYGVNKPLVNVSGCPPIPEVITGTIMYYLLKGMPGLDDLKRPTVYYGRTVHEDCLREENFDDDGLFTTSFDDTAARQGACLFDLGCKGPVTHNACARVKWNQGTSYPMLSGHGCIGCAEHDFWDMGKLGPLGDKQWFYFRLTKALDYDGHGRGRACNSCHDGDGF